MKERAMWGGGGGCRPGGLRERGAVVRGVNDLGIKRATHSPISSLLDNAVIEVIVL